VKVKILYLVLILFPILGIGQDIHFSQITRTELLINPALTGMFDGNIRATMNWKDQWRSVDKSFRTYASSAEFSFGRGLIRQPAYYAIGIHAAKDVSGDIELGTTNIGVSVNSLIKIARNQRLAIGAQTAYSKTGFIPAAMEWGSQYSGLSFDPALYDGEGIEYLPQQYWDFSAGVAWWYHKTTLTSPAFVPLDAKFGMAVYHINRPENSFVLTQSSRLPVRASFHGSALFATPLEGVYWYPSLNIAVQGPQQEILPGIMGKLTLKPGSKMTGMTAEFSLAAGFSMRFTNVFDAIIPQVFLDFKTFSLGMSYDINLSNLNLASNYRGGFEFSIRFTNPDGFTHKNPFRKVATI
jgi:type IX secretion system PorP/SprF family membrane protein